MGRIDSQNGVFCLYQPSKHAIKHAFTAPLRVHNNGVAALGLIIALGSVTPPCTSLFLHCNTAMSERRTLLPRNVQYFEALQTVLTLFFADINDISHASRSLTVPLNYF